MEPAMIRNSWLAMTGLSILLATSVAQTHPILLDAASYPSGGEVGDAYGDGTRSQVAFTEVAERTTMLCWHKAEGEGATTSGEGASGNCMRQKRLVRGARATDSMQLNSTLASNSHPAGVFEAAGGLLSLAPVLTISHSQIQQLLRLISTAGGLGGISIGGHGGHSIVNGIRHNGGSTTTPNVPEPETLVLMMMGLIGAAIATRSRRQPSK
jgi:hypothetical protein